MPLLGEIIKCFVTFPINLVLVCNDIQIADSSVGAHFMKWNDSLFQ